MFLAGSATMFLLTAGPVVSGRAFANVYLFMIFLGYPLSDPNYSLNANCLELQMSNWKSQIIYWGGKKEISHPVIGASHTLYGASSS